ncbi:unnamed protein product [Chrysoparadoxa australica]
MGPRAVAWTSVALAATLTASVAFYCPPSAPGTSAPSSSTRILFSGWRQQYGTSPRRPLIPGSSLDPTVEVVYDTPDFREEEGQEEPVRSPKRGLFERPTSEVQREVVDLIREIGQVTRSSGPQVNLQRGVQATVAVLKTGADLLRDIRAKARDGQDIKGERRGFGLRGMQDGVRSMEKEDIARTLRVLFERMGATYIKLGQFIASSPTLFPSEYVMEFQKCLDATEPVSYTKISRMIREGLGGSGVVSKEFLYIDPKPLASASVAQVHRAKLRSGEEVVIKVRKPGAEAVLKADLGFIYIASRVVELLQPELARTSFSNIVGDIRESMLEELDFRKEASNIEEFRTFLQEAGITEAVAPRVYNELSSEKVLVMERLRGVPLTDLEGIKKYSANPELTLITALNTWSLSVMMAPSFHADVHAGNLMVMEDGRIGFIDFGIVGRIPQRVWGAIRDLSDGFINSDFQAMAAALVQMGAADGDVDINAFAHDLQQIFLRLRNLDSDVTVTSLDGPDGRVGFGTQVDFNQEEVTRLLVDIVGVAEDNGLKLPREFGLLIKQALYFDRYTRILAPEIDVLADNRINLPSGDFADTL